MSNQACLGMPIVAIGKMEVPQCLHYSAVNTFLDDQTDAIQEDMSRTCLCLVSIFGVVLFRLLSPKFTEGS